MAAELAAANAGLKSANDRMLAELKAAAVVQQSLLPQSIPDLRDVRIAWRFRPCVELAGDAVRLVPERALDKRSEHWRRRKHQHRYESKQLPI